jgi:hypothetical protein
MKKKLSFLLVILIMLFSCSQERKRPDISGINVIVNIKRFDKDLFSGNLDSIPNHVLILKQKYGEFFDIFNYKIIQLSDYKAVGYPRLLKAYLTDFSVNQWYTKCNALFPDVKFLESGLTQAFRYYKYYFPQKSVPEVSTFIGGLSQTIVTSDTCLGVALDKYLGRDCELYLEVNPPMPAYLRNKMYKGKMVSDCMRGWLLSEFEKSDTARTLLENMVYQGKILYTLKNLIPDDPDSVTFGYEAKQIKWLERNEKNMWTYMVEKKLIYSTDQVIVKKFTDEAPFTKDFGRESPGQAGSWIGYRIVSAYMKKNSQLGIPELISESDCLKILEGSRYDP